MVGLTYSFEKYGIYQILPPPLLSVYGWALSTAREVRRGMSTPDIDDLGDFTKKNTNRSYDDRNRSVCGNRGPSAYPSTGKTVGADGTAAPRVAADTAARDLAPRRGPSFFGSPA